MTDNTRKKSETKQVCPTASNPITEEVRSLIEVFACETIRFCGFSKSDIDDLCQIYSLAVVDALPRYDSEKGNYLAFVRGILFRAKNNIFRTRIRKGTDNCTVPIDDLPEESPFFIDEYTLPPDQQLERKERVEEINKTFESLEPLQKKVCILLMKKRNYSEIMRQLNIPKSMFYRQIMPEIREKFRKFVRNTGV